MGYLFLIVFLAGLLLLETILDNMWWIGSIFIAIMLFSLFGQIRSNWGSGFDGGEFTIEVLKIGAIAFTVWLMIQCA